MASAAPQNAGASKSPSKGISGASKRRVNMRDGVSQMNKRKGKPIANPEPITGLLALAAAGVGGAAMRKRKQQDEDQE